ncbi:CAP domain-containing protein [Roseimaritima multifibrata]|nr:CAP domain-containing protein [Roseimaritima multifibrata]
MSIITMGIASGQDARPASTATGSAKSTEIITAVQRAIVDQTNEFRKSNQLEAVQRNEPLMQAAKKFAEFMARTDKYGHRANGMTPAQRAEKAGYDYCIVRENIAYRTNTGDVTAASLIEVFVQGWIDSPPHRENMLADYITQTGAAVATTDGVTYYAVQLFGRPQSAAFQLKLTNDSQKTETIRFEANDQRDEVELQPQMTVTMTRCLPTKVSLARSDESKTVRSDATFRVTNEGTIEPSETP